MTTTRHQQLIDAGWRYDAAQDRYKKPLGAVGYEGTLYNLDAAWLHFQTGVKSERASETPAKGTRAVDPRRQEPQ